MKRGFYFKTNHGSTYYYDDITGNVCLSDKDKDGIIYGEKCNENVSVNKTDIKEYLKYNGFTQLILMVTEDCNIRCKYCVYSDNYTNTRVHNNLYMTTDIAKKAVMNYIESFKNIKYNNPFIKPVISFYGGEPLLNINLINDVVEYSKKIYPNKIIFNMTTNGVLLNDDTIDFLAKNEFSLSLSLNGKKEEHDRMRVFSNGNGTFDILFKNIMRIRELYPEYYKKFCSIVITFDLGTDFIELNKFITENKDILPNIARINPVSTLFTSWYDKYSDKDKIKQINDLDQLRKLYIYQLKNTKIDPLLNHLFKLEHFYIMNRPINVSIDELKPKFLKYTGACVPGTKLAVDSSGKIHCCERVSESMPIGDVDNWINCEKIEEILQRYSDAVIEDCQVCPIQRLCDICYSHLCNENGEFCKEDKELCSKAVEFYRDRFSKTWDLIENGIYSDEILNS